jgi:hypothetical protein
LIVPTTKLTYEVEGHTGRLTRELYDELDTDTSSFVVGPSSSVDGDIALMSGTSGKNIRDSGYKVNNSSGNMVFGATNPAWSTRNLWTKTFGLKMSSR